MMVSFIFGSRNSEECRGEENAGQAAEAKPNSFE
jgi:hypothetical protein